MALLFVNACMRGKKSRTLELCRTYLEGCDDVVEIDLAQLNLRPFDGALVEFRSQKLTEGAFEDSLFDLAHQFAAADEVLIGAPYWDLSFPAALKVYLEHCSVCDITFHYTPDARCEGLCRAARLTYITTCGGALTNANYGYDYLCGIATMFGIPEARFAAAELLDVEGVDVAAIMAEARERIALLKAEV